MKEQFLNLTGLTELVGYLKTSIANHKEILPYASNKLFPSVGDINIIYIDTDTNTIYRWDSSSKTYITLAKAVKSVTISEATENGKITLTVDGNKTTVPIHGLGSAAYTNSSAYSPAGHTHTKAQVGLGNVDNTADANKNVKHATTADSATIAGTATNVSAGEGTADAARHVWFSDSTTETKRAYSDKFKYNPVTNNLTVNVTGNATTATSANKLNTNAGSATKPVYFSGGVPVACSYTLGKSVPADALFTDHTYGNMKGATSSAAGSAGLVPAPNIGEQLKFLRADGTWVIPTNTTYSVGTSNYSGITKLYTETGSATDGTMTQKAITTALNGKSATGHTHAYAGSSSAGGVANSAAKLSTARTVSGGTDIIMSFNYDGSGNSGASIKYYDCAANNGNTNNYPFHRFAKLDTITEPYVDKATTFLITQDYIGGGFGIVRVVLRAERSGIVSNGEIKWLVRSGLDADSVQMGLYNVFGSTYADLFFKSSGTYAGTVFRAIANGNRGSVSRTWVLINSNEVSGTTSSDKKTSTEVYTSIASAATALHKKAYSITVSGVDSGSTSYANSAGNSTKWNGYTLDIGTANTKDTWLLVANNNMIQHKLTTDFADSKHTHNYAGSGSAGGSANSAVKLATARSINGTNFDGTGNITTANWGTARTITVGNTGKSVNGSGNVSWSLGEIGIHVSKTMPTASDGKNGDIWIVYE